MQDESQPRFDPSRGFAAARKYVRTNVERNIDCDRGDDEPANKRSLRVHRRVRNGRDWLRWCSVLLRTLHREIRQANRLRQPVVAGGDLAPDLSEGGAVHSKNSKVRP
jgi:hypothetical protein